MPITTRQLLISAADLIDRFDRSALASREGIELHTRAPGFEGENFTAILRGAAQPAPTPEHIREAPIALPVLPFEVWIVWGKALMDTDGPSHYSFATQNELKAFLEGVNEAVGWMDHSEFETEQEGRDHINQAVEEEEANAQT